MTARSPRKPFSTEASRWRAIETRDAQADEHFVYGVKTTGVYCRPSSSTRLPNRENVEFFPNPEAAEAAGYRASRRSKGDRTSAARERAQLVADACRRIDAADSPLTLDALAGAAGLSRYHFHKVFKAETGLTPKAYAKAARARKVRRELGTKGQVARAIYDAGFGSSSRFYEASNDMLGMRARDYRAGGAGMEIHFAVGECSLGSVLVAQTRRGICAIFLGGDPEKLVRDLEDQFPNAELVGGDEKFERVVARVVGFLETPKIGLNLPLDLRGTAFQERVWHALTEIPFGSTITYTELASRLEAPRSVRAVARACATNRVAVAIPCHRVVRRDGDLAGYRWGIERKRAILNREADES